MSFGEAIYLGIVVAAFVIFSITLATVAWRTDRFMHDQRAPQAEKPAEPNARSKAV